MGYCTKCGAENDAQNYFCSHCGAVLSASTTTANAGVSPSSTSNIGLESNEKTLIFFGNVCISPLLGTILYFVWKDNKPQKSHEVCSLTLWAFGLWVLVVILAIVIGFVAAEL